MSLRNAFFSGLCVAALLVSAALIYPLLVHGAPQPEALLRCYELPDTNLKESNACLHSAVASMLKKYSPSEIIALAHADTAHARGLVSHCHELAHVVGSESLKNTGSLEKTLALCPSQCSNGCMHGAIQEEVFRDLGEKYVGEDIVHADAATIRALGAKYCERSYALCHGIGHILVMASTDMFKSLSTCDAIGGSFTNGCYQGVFMESFGGALSFRLGTSTLDVSKGSGYPCSTLEEKYQHACFRNLPTAIDPPPNYNGVPNSLEVCGKLSASARKYCYQGVGANSFVSAALLKDPLHANYCSTITGKRDFESCLVGVAEKLFSFGSPAQATAVCDGITDKILQLDCDARTEN